DGGRTGRRREQVVSGRHPSGELDIHLALRIAAPPDSLHDIALPFPGLNGNRQLNALSASLQASQVRIELERPAMVGSDHLVHPVAELEPAIFHRDPELSAGPILPQIDLKAAAVGGRDGLRVSIRSTDGPVIHRCRAHPVPAPCCAAPYSAPWRSTTTSFTTA